MRHCFIFLLVTVLAGTAQAQLPDLIFSEYVEGLSNEKYIEIYNGTGSTVSLGGYSVELYANGSAGITSTTPLSGSLGNGQVVVLRHNLSTLYTGPAITAAVCNYNGDDALVLKNGTTTIDVFGKVGCDPGTAWVLNSCTTLDRTLVRRPDVCTGYDGSETGCAFSRLRTEWIVKSTNDISNLGSHYAGCGNANLSNRYFRSKQSGTWYDINTWESASSSAGPYTNASCYPAYDNTDSIIISGGDSVSLSRAVLPLDQLYTETGAVFIMGDSADIDLNPLTNSIELNIDGTFIDSTKSTGSFGIAIIGTGATWRLGVDGSFVKLRGSSSTFYRDNFEGGISTIPATAHWYLRCIDAANLPAFVSANMYYPNLVIENISGTAWDMSTGALGSFSGTTTVIKGNFDIGGTGTSAVTVAHNSATAIATSNQLDAGGDVFVRAGSHFVNMKSGSPNFYGGGLNVKGNVTVDGTLQIVNSMTDNVRSALTLSGTADQSISGAGTISLTSFELNKQGASTDVFTTTNITVTDSLYLTRGVLQTNGSSVISGHDTLVISSPASLYTNLPANIGWEQSYIRGRFAVVDFGGAPHAGPYAVPVGQGSFRPLFLRNFSCTGSFTIEHFTGNPRTVFTNVMGSGLDHISSMEYWIIDAPTGSPTANVELSFYDPNSGGVTSMPDLRVAHFTGSQWNDEGNTATLGTAGSNGSVTSGTISSYSPFTLASVNATNPLPLHHIGLTGSFTNNQARLQWVVNGDADAREYVLERSANGRDFTAVHTVASQRSATTAAYTTTTAMNDSRSYFRTRARLQNGQELFSNIILLADQPQSLLVYPNPARDRIQVTSSLTGYQYTVMNGHGAVVLSGRSASSTTTIFTGALPAGLYYLRIIDAEGGKTGQTIMIK